MNEQIEIAPAAAPGPATARTRYPVRADTSRLLVQPGLRARDTTESETRDREVQRVQVPRALHTNHCHFLFLRGPLYKEQRAAKRTTANRGQPGHMGDGVSWGAAWNLPHLALSTGMRPTQGPPLATSTRPNAMQSLAQGRAITVLCGPALTDA